MDLAAFGHCVVSPACLAVGPVGSAHAAAVLSKWEQYAQVLLETNEFAFVE